jgi:putative transposase
LQTKALKFNTSLTNEISDLWSKYSFLGYRKITAILRTEKNCRINCKKVLRLMRELGLQAIYAKPRTTIVNKNHQKFPYLLRDLEINQVNQVWSVDITYIKTPRGFVYLVALIDVFSRFVISAKLSISMDTEFCLEILAKALKQSHPKIINSDQGSQFTSNEWVNSLTSNNIQISMDGVGRWADNIYIERFWRTIKQEEIYINPSDNLTDLHNQITKFIEFYNYQRPHQSLKYLTPSQVFYDDNTRRKRIF